jgi:hypothetical protein
MLLSMRFYLPALLTVLLVAVPSVHAQIIPSNFSVDATLRMECLFSTHSVGDAHPPEEESERFGQDFDFQLPILLGEISVSSRMPVAARLLGFTSVWESSSTLSRSSLDQSASGASEIQLNARPKFAGWETAGFYHLWQGFGHTYSIGVGYRQGYWSLHGEGVGTANAESRSEDNVFSSGPFLSMRTAMVLPGWRASFELIASKFMNRSIESVLLQPGFSTGYEARAYGGGLVEAQVRGMTYFTRRILLGAYGSYSMQELSGSFSMKTNGNIRATYDAHLTETRLMLGLEMTVVF